MDVLVLHFINISTAISFITWRTCRCEKLKRDFCQNTYLELSVKTVFQKAMPTVLTSILCSEDVNCTNATLHYTCAIEHRYCHDSSCTVFGQRIVNHCKRYRMVLQTVFKPVLWFVAISWTSTTPCYTSVVERNFSQCCTCNTFPNSLLTTTGTTIRNAFALRNIIAEVLSKSSVWNFYIKTWSIY